jgi:hypothetical protein
VRVIECPVGHLDHQTRWDMGIPYWYLAFILLGLLYQL